LGLTDPIGDMLTALRNASHAGKPHLEVPASRLAERIAECLKQEGFIQNWRKISGGNPQGVLRIYLKYAPDGKPVLRHIRRISKPGLRIYRRKDQLRPIYSGIGVAILTTSRGVLTDAQARKEGVGGEVICHVW